jgi:transcription initiation factor IIE alpha subunit
MAKMNYAKLNYRDKVRRNGVAGYGKKYRRPKKATRKQLKYLYYLGIAHPRNITKSEAHKLISEKLEKRKQANSSLALKKGQPK